MQTHLQTGASLIGALGALYEAGEVFAAPGSVVRDALESAARDFWIIGDGTDLEESPSAEGAKKAAARKGGKETGPYAA